MRRKQTQPLGEVLANFLEENPLLAEKLAETRVINAWGHVLGTMTLKYTTHIYIKNKTLFVRLSSSVLRSELSMCRDQLIRKLNLEAGSDVIREIILT